LNVKFGTWNLSFQWINNQWVPIDREGSILYDWSNNAILTKLSVKLGDISPETIAWDSASIIQSSTNEIIDGLK
jgi:hypothetical protein